MTTPPRKRRLVRSTPQASTAAPQRTQSPIPDPPDIGPVAVHGVFIDTVSVIPKTSASLHVLPGRLGASDAEERRKVLVPFAELRLGGGPIKEPGDVEVTNSDDPPTIFSANVPLENLAYVLLDLTSDLRRMCQEVGQIASGELVVDPARMGSVRYFVAHLERQARLCRAQLDQTYGPPAAISS